LGDQIEKNEKGGAENIAHKWEMRGAYRILVGRPEVKRHLECLGLDGRTTLK
jgi:hypothetical protein